MELMKACVYTKYGPPEVIQLMEVPKPIPTDQEVLVKVYASTINRTDAGFRSATYFISRFWSGLLRPKYKILGCAFAGVVVEMGKDVKEFKCGDKVFGFNDASFGGHGEFLTMAANKAISTMPDNCSFEIAASLIEGGHYALSNIGAANVQPAQQVLVYGASGAIGSAAVPLLKYFGAMVTAVCNTKNVALVKSLGAHKVIDYQTEDFTKTENKFDFIFDAVGKSSFGQCKPLLTKKGMYISTELGKNGENVLLALTTPLWGGKKVLFPIPTIGKKELDFLKERFQQGEFIPVIDRHYRMDQMVEAYHYVESGQKTGNVILNVV